MRYVDHIEHSGQTIMTVQVRRWWWPWSWRAETWVRLDSRHWSRSSDGATVGFFCGYDVYRKLEGLFQSNSTLMDWAHSDKVVPIRRVS